MMCLIADLPPLHKMTEDLWYHALKFLDKYRYNARPHGHHRALLVIQNTTHGKYDCKV